MKLGKLILFYINELSASFELRLKHVIPFSCENCSNELRVPLYNYVCHWTPVSNMLNYFLLLCTAVLVSYQCNQLTKWIFQLQTI